MCVECDGVVVLLPVMLFVDFAVLCYCCVCLCVSVFVFCLLSECCVCCGCIDVLFGVAVVVLMFCLTLLWSS